MNNVTHFKKTFFKELATTNYDLNNKLHICTFYIHHIY